jgi:hypothetical protein
MAGVASARGAPKCILDRSGVLLHSPHAVLQCFGEHFIGVLGGGGDISLSAQNLLGTLVCEVEFSLGAKGEVCDEPSLQKVVECIVALHNATTPRADGIIALLLKAELEPAT